MSLFIVSDLHIWGPEDPLYSSLLSLIRNRALSGDTVVLAGDIFDLFVGNKEIFAQRYREFFQSLSDASGRDVHLHYVEGNHDFLLHRTFQNIPNLQVHPHSFSLAIQDKRFYFAHGDTVNRKDYGYLFLRSFFRSPFIRAFVTCAPGRWIEKIGMKSSTQSKKVKPRLTSDLPIQRMEYLRKAYRSYAAEQLAQGHDFVVMGHCHDLDEMMFHVSGRQGQYINVGFPRVHGSFLSWAPGEEKIQREKLP